MSERVDAKTKIGPAEALRLARGAAKVIAAKGKQVVVFEMRKDKPSDAALREVLLGRTGNLRAPAMRRGDVLIVGFAEGEYRGLLGRPVKGER